MIFTQIVTAAFFSLQWIIMFMYSNFTSTQQRSVDQWSIIFFTSYLSNNFYYVNNVKSFYVSLLTSNLYRKVFTESIFNCLRLHKRQRLQGERADNSIKHMGIIGQKIIQTKGY
jgi:hypothetical protein